MLSKDFLSPLPGIQLFLLLTFDEPGELADTGEDMPGTSSVSGVCGRLPLLPRVLGLIARLYGLPCWLVGLIPLPVIGGSRGRSETAVSRKSANEGDLDIGLLLDSLPIGGIVSDEYDISSCSWSRLEDRE